MYLRMNEFEKMVNCFKNFLFDYKVFESIFCKFMWDIIFEL